MEKYQLLAHPAFPPRHVRSITASLSLEHEQWVRLRWRIEGAGRIVVPPLAGRRRADDLWKTTCFELFIASQEPAHGAYLEYNFSPSEAWASYQFRAYREGLTDGPMPRSPVIDWRGSGDLAIMDVALPRSVATMESWNFGLNAVIEEEGGARSYWAIAHPPGDKPDFHARACFAGRLEAPPRA